MGTGDIYFHFIFGLQFINELQIMKWLYKCWICFQCLDSILVDFIKFLGKPQDKTPGG